MSATAERIAFLDRRRAGLGGSDMGAILGLNAYRTPFQVWQEKTGRGAPDDGNLQMRFGQFAEQFVAEEYSRQTGGRVQRYNAMLCHPTAPLIGHVDRLVVPEGAKVASHRREIRTDRGLECKTAGVWAAGRDSDWGESGTDQVPESYLVQCATYMALTGCTRWDLAVLIGGSQELRIYHLSRDSDLEEMLLETAAEWWARHVEADEPPEPSTELEARQRWAAHRPGRVLEVDTETRDALAELQALKARIKALENEAQTLRDRIIPRLEDADEVQFDGQRIATWRANKPSRRTDWRALVHHHWPVPPSELVEQFTTTQPGARVLRISKELTA